MKNFNTKTFSDTPRDALHSIIEWNGFEICIENARGTYRYYKDSDNNTIGESLMMEDYGFISGVVGEDGDSLDVFVGPNRTSNKVFVVYQVNEDGSFDEHKCLLGFDNIRQAELIYKAHYDSDSYFGGIEEKNLIEFGEFIESMSPTNILGTKTLSDTNRDSKLYSFMTTDYLKRLSNSMKTRKVKELKEAHPTSTDYQIEKMYYEDMVRNIYSTGRTSEELDYIVQREMSKKFPIKNFSTDA